MWTRVLRPQWNARNKIVHALDQTTKRTREQSDLLEEVKERYRATNHEMLAYDDRKLFDMELEQLLQKLFPYLRA